MIWLNELIPRTPNEEAYDYDAQGTSRKMERPITRDDIVDSLMEVSEQDCLGTLSNIHLAYTDRERIGAEICKTLAGYISQEVDAAKTGKHPVTEEEIQRLRDGLNNQWPDFMKSKARREYYPSQRVLGQFHRFDLLVKRIKSFSSRQIVSSRSSCCTRLATSH